MEDIDVLFHCLSGGASNVRLSIYVGGLEINVLPVDQPMWNLSLSCFRSSFGKPDGWEGLEKGKESGRCGNTDRIYEVGGNELR